MSWPEHTGGHPRLVDRARGACRLAPRPKPASVAALSPPAFLTTRTVLAARSSSRWHSSPESSAAIRPRCPASPAKKPLGAPTDNPLRSQPFTASPCPTLTPISLRHDRRRVAARKPRVPRSTSESSSVRSALASGGTPRSRGGTTSRERSQAADRDRSGRSNAVRVVQSEHPQYPYPGDPHAPPVASPCCAACSSERLRGEDLIALRRGEPF